MSKVKIEKAQDRMMTRYRLAAQIREMLDAARKEYGVAEWDSDDMESEIAELAFADD